MAHECLEKRGLTDKQPVRSRAFGHDVPSGDSAPRTAGAHQRPRLSQAGHSKANPRKIKRGFSTGTCA